LSYRTEVHTRLVTIEDQHQLLICDRCKAMRPQFGESGAAGWLVVSPAITGESFNVSMVRHLCAPCAEAVFK
jgi:hypothetical protein